MQLSGFATFNYILVIAHLGMKTAIMTVIFIILVKSICSYIYHIQARKSLWLQNLPIYPETLTNEDPEREGLSYAAVFILLEH